MINKPVFFLFFLFIMTTVQAQNYRTTSFDAKSNYFEIVNAERAKLKPFYKLKDKKSKKKIKQFERWASFWKDRIKPDGSFVTARFTYNEWKKDKQVQRRFKKTGLKKMENWALIGPTEPPLSAISNYPGMGRVNTIAFNGTDTNIMYIGSPSGGIWKTTDGGETWVPKGDDLPNMGISHIVIDPTNTNTIYIASGDFDGQHTRSLGVFKSTDGGNNWNVITGLTFGLTEDNSIAKLLIDSNNTTTLFATTKNNIKKSTDGGDTWFDVYTINQAFFNDIAYKVGSDDILYATSKFGGFYISTNNGNNWDVASEPAFSRLDFALTVADANQIISLDEDGTIRKSTDQGSTWTELTSIDGYDSQGGYNMAIAVSPLNKDLILVAGVHGWRSKDGGKTWKQYLDGYWEEDDPSFYVHSDHHDMVFVPESNIAFSVNDGGINKGDVSLDAAWKDLSNGLAITQYYSVAGTPQNAGFLIVGAQDNDIAHYDGNEFNGKNPSSDGVEGLWDYSNSDIAWTCSQNGGLERTMDGFVTSEYLETTPEDAPFVWELEIHPTVPTTIFGGFGDIYKSTDRGDKWTNLNSGVGTIKSISIAPSDANTIYVSGEYGGLKKTVDGGTTWTAIELPQDGFVKSIEVHPTNPNEVYIAYSGYANGKVYTSTNGGTSWIDITGSLPNIPTHKILYKTGTTDGELFLATDLGVYYRTNTAGDWVKLGTGLPNVIVQEIEIHYGTEKLRAATFGRGLWEIPITAAALGVKDELLDENALNVYPNPTINKTFTLQLNGLNGTSNIIIYNIIGTVVKELNTTNIKETIHLNNYSTGIYLVKVINNGKSITKKIIVK